MMVKDMMLNTISCINSHQASCYSDSKSLCCLCVTTCGWAWIHSWLFKRLHVSRLLTFITNQWYIWFSANNFTPWQLSEIYCSNSNMAMHELLNWIFIIQICGLFNFFSFPLELPRVSVNPRNQTFKTGDEVRIRCSAIGYPPPRLLWTHNDMFIMASSRWIHLPQHH